MQRSEFKPPAQSPPRLGPAGQTGTNTSIEKEVGKSPVKSDKTEFPPEWEDDERMGYLFSAFKQTREVNSLDWDGKMEFWCPLIVNTCRQRGVVSISLGELNDIFRRKGTSPLGLGTILQDMIRRGKLQKESEFAANVDAGWISWGVGLLLVKPLKWTLSTILGSNRVPLEETYVMIDLVKEKASKLLQVYRSSPAAQQALVPFQELRAIAADICPDENTLCLALLQLQREKQVNVTLHDGEKIVKFTQPGQSRVSPVGDVDLGIYQLQKSEKLLEEKIEALASEAERCKEEARGLLHEDKKTQALRCLRAKKRIEKRSDSLYAQLDTIHGILEKIANSHTDRMVIQAYQTGVATLKQSLKDVTVEKAENLVDQIQELSEMQDEVNQTLSGFSLDSTVDDMDLEAELAILMQDSTPDGPSALPDVPDKPVSSNPARVKSEEGLVASLPAVPNTDLGITEEELEQELNRLTLVE
ncbi:charged multivesicular body protein 7 [Erpetoichthys calabaricus]|uniref:Charged multivesicular body protein 7 n=1 Tax=Erpetoichthys calabaricus TaxID=27687 RepID=A0A8C4RC70_ERPCA|nr:charged multivesicular body protein 7 [Erpetoichthys calabaricus]